MELNDDAKDIVQSLAQAINRAVERSTEVAWAIDRLRQVGYELDLTLKLQIGLRELDEEGHPVDDEPSDFFELTDEDRRTLRRMKIRIDEDD